MHSTSDTSAPHLAGNFAPVPDEITAHALDVTGAIPRN